VGEVLFPIGFPLVFTLAMFFFVSFTLRNEGQRLPEFCRVLLLQDNQTLL
jgi:hypothetical protein